MIFHSKETDFFASYFADFRSPALGCVLGRNQREYGRLSVVRPQVRCISRTGQACPRTRLESVGGQKVTTNHTKPSKVLSPALEALAIKISPCADASRLSVRHPPAGCAAQVSAAQASLLCGAPLAHGRTA